VRSCSGLSLAGLAFGGIKNPDKEKRPGPYRPGRF
jgi:hypothetical protein